MNEECDYHGKAGQDNLIVRKVYGEDQIRYLRCRACRAEFSERKGTALWNTKVSEEKAVQVAKYLNEGCSQASTTRLVGVDKSTVSRLARRIGQHAKGFHDAKVRDADVDVLQADERYGFAGDKARQDWKGELIDPESKMVLSFVTGRSNETLIRELLGDAASRLADKHNIVLMTDGLERYHTLFPEIFGRPYQPPRKGSRGRLPPIPPPTSRLSRPILGGACRR